MALAHANLGYCQLKLGKHTDAIASYEKARSLAPEDPQHAHDLGCIHYEKGEKQKAFDCFLDAVKADPGHGDARAALEKVRVELGIAPEDPRLITVPILAPKGAPAAEPEKTAPRPEERRAPGTADRLAELLARGRDRYEEGKFEEALEAWSEAVRLDPKSAIAHNNRAAALIELGRYQEAIEACSDALNAQPDYAIAHMTRGEIYAKLGNRDAVMREYMSLNALDEQMGQQLLELIKTIEEPSE
jgi:tetratricopeptide (TPR) repeat protein